MYDNLRERYRSIANNRGGIFTSTTRKRLLGISPGRPGWSEDTADFRYRVRIDVEQGLIDLALYIDVADVKDTLKIVNEESLTPIIKALFWKPTIERTKPNADLAKIANMLIWYSYHYLKTQNPIRLPNVLDSNINDAIEMSNYLTECFELSSSEKAAGNSPIIAR